MKMRKKTLALLLFSVAFMCSIGVSAFVLWQTDALRLQEAKPAVSPSVQTGWLYPAMNDEGLWGYIDENGEWQIEPAFEEARCFGGKAAWVKLGGLWGAVDMSGAYIVVPEYGRIEEYRDGENCFMAAFESVNSVQEKNSALYDINGQKLFGLAGELRAPSSGLMAFSRVKGDEVRWGYINPHGEIIIEPIYAAAGQAAGNFALVQEVGVGKQLLNIYAKTGTACDAAYDLNSVGSRLILTADDESGLFGYIDVDGNLQIDYSLAAAEAFRGGAALAAEPKASGTSGAYLRYGLLTTDGVWAIEPEYLSGEYLDNGIYAMKLDGEAGYHLVNALGDELLDGVVYSFEGWQNGLLACHMQEETRFLNTDGEVVEISTGLQPHIVVSGGLWGYMDENGATWYNAEGEEIIATGHTRELAGGLELRTELACESGAFLAYYPVIASETGEPDDSWRRLNTALREQAVDDYEADALAGGEVNFVVRGDFAIEQQAGVMTICQRVSLSDGWKNDGGEERAVHTVCFDMASGRQYRLGDLFKDDVNWRSALLEPLTISYELSQAARGEVTMVEVLELLEKRLARNVDFSCGESGLVLYFGLSDGNVAEIPLLYADIEQLIDREGAMWQALAIGAEN